MNLIEAAQAALDALEALHGGCTDSDDGTVEAITVWCPEIITALRAALAEPAETPSTNKELLALIERLQARYGVSFLGSERAMLHFARDWVFLTTPAAPTPKAEPVAWADQIIEDLNSQYDTDGIREDDSGDPLIRLEDAIAAVEDAAMRHAAPTPKAEPDDALDALRFGDGSMTTTKETS